jgi:hypothetical protein
MKHPTLIFDVDYTLYNSKDIPQEENDTEDITELFYSLFKPKQKLYKMLEKYIGKTFLFSNGNLSHVNEVIEKINLKKLFSNEKIATLDNYPDKPKPYVQSYNFAIKKFSIQSTDTVYFFEDNIDNLKVAKKKFNWNTIYIDEKKTTDKKLSHYPFIDYTFKDINKALTYVMKKIEKQIIKKNHKQHNKQLKNRRISPKMSPRRKRTRTKKIDKKINISNNTRQRTNRSVVRSPFKHRKIQNNYMTLNRLERIGRMG